MKKIRTGVIGVGYLGRFHAQKYAGMEHVELIGVADPDSRRTQLVAEECGCAQFDDYHDLLQEVDALSIVVPTILHHTIAKECLQHFVDILVEKPFTTTLAEADELIELSKKHNRLIQVGHLERYNPALLAARPLLTSPLFIEAHRLSVFNPRGTDVDVVLDLMIHDIDIILSLVNSPVKTIHGVGVPVITPRTDIANARVIFANGCTANITASRVSMKNMRRMRIFQPGKYLAVDFNKKEVLATSVKRSQSRQDAIFDTTTHGHKDQDVLKTELTDFINNVRQRRIPLVSGNEGKRALETALDIRKHIAACRSQVQDIFTQCGEPDPYTLKHELIS